MHALRPIAVVLWSLSVLPISVSTVRAETPNPFGNVQKGPGAAQPSPGKNAFPEEEDFPPDSDFGLPPNGNTPPSPPGNPPSDVPNTPQLPLGAGGRPPSPLGNQNRPSLGGNSFPSPGGTSGQVTTTVKKQTKTAPKLADYLELDSSVKSLEVKNFDLPDKDIKDVVTLISKWTGKNFILDNKVRGKITIIGPSQVTLQEAYNAFLSALEANGLTTVQSGKFIRIIESAEARRSPVKTYSGEFAPKDDQFITRIFQLKYINSEEVTREFRDLTTRQGKLFSYEPTNSIIITDTGSNIQRIKEILETLDVKNFETTLHVLRIRNGSAKAISEMLGEIYGDDKKGATGARSFRRSALERTRGGGVISKIIPDDQTNSLIVLANQAGYQQLLTLVGRLDVKVTDTGRIHVYYCEYAKAEDLAATLASLSGGSSAKSGSSSRKTNVSVPTVPGQTAPGAGQTAPPVGASGPVTAELEGGVKVTSDSATNALVITANASDYKTLRRVIKKLDIPRLQVFVETAILEVSLDKNTNVGVSVAGGAPGSRAFAGGFIGDATNLTSYIAGGIPEGATIPVFAGPTFQSQVTSAQGTTSTISVSSFMGLLNLLTKNTASSVLSTPQIIAMDNEKAEFKVQDEIPVQSSFTLTPGATTGQVGTGNITTLKTGIDIKLTPQINAASKTIRLQIEQTVESLKDTNSVPQALINIQRAKTSRVTNTSVVVRDQDYVMLGGLMSDKVDETSRKVPLLGDIPILGWLFKSKTFTTSKSNLVILLRPKIIDTTLAGAQLVQTGLNRRDEFIKQNGSAEDLQKAEVTKLRARVKKQEERGNEAPRFDYRNNENDDELGPEKPGQSSELEPKKERSSSNKGGREEGQQPLLGGSENRNILMPPPGGNPPFPPGGNAPNNPADLPPPPPDTPFLESAPQGGGL